MPPPLVVVLDSLFVVRSYLQPRNRRFSHGNGRGGPFGNVFCLVCSALLLYDDGFIGVYFILERVFLFYNSASTWSST